MLDDKQRLWLVDLFTPAIIGADGRDILLMAMSEALRPRLRYLDAPVALLELAINICAEDAFNHDPPALSEFITAMARRAPGHKVELDALAARLKIRTPEQDPYSDLYIHGSLPFLDRQPLRHEVRKLLSRDTYQPILIVNGDTRVGKSFTTLFIEHVSKRGASIRACPIEVGPGEQPSIADIAEDMVAILTGAAGTLPPQTSTNMKRWPQDVANAVWGQLTQAAQRDGSVWVIILDGLGRSAQGGAPTVDAETAIFVQQLAKLVRTNSSGHRHRLVLIEYDQTGLSQLQADLRGIALKAISRQEARSEVQRLFVALGLAGQAAALAEEILADMPDPIADLGPLAERCARMIESVA
jgi:hypothetical protein